MIFDLIFKTKAGRFILFGSANTVFSYLVFFMLFVFFGLGEALSLGVSFFWGVLFNFLGHKKIVFRTDKGEFFLFIAFYLLLYLMNLAFLSYFSKFGDFSPVAVQFALLPFVAIISFLGSRRILEGKPSKG